VVGCLGNLLKLQILCSEHAVEQLSSLLHWQHGVIRDLFLLQLALEEKQSENATTIIAKPFPHNCINLCGLHVCFSCAHSRANTIGATHLTHADDINYTPHVDAVRSPPMAFANASHELQHDVRW
jgi:hypothetical protein